MLIKFFFLLMQATLQKTCNFCSNSNKQTNKHKYREVNQPNLFEVIYLFKVYINIEDFDFFQQKIRATKNMKRTLSALLVILVKNLIENSKLQRLLFLHLLLFSNSIFIDNTTQITTTMLRGQKLQSNAVVALLFQ